MAIYYCIPGACQITQNLLNFYMLITLKHKNVVEKFVKNVYGEKHSFFELTNTVGVYIGIACMRQFQSVQATYVTEIKETYFEIYNYHESCP